MDKLKTYAKQNDLYLIRTGLDAIDKKGLLEMQSEYGEAGLKLLEEKLHRGRDVVVVREWWLCFCPANDVWVALLGLSKDSASSKTLVEVLLIHTAYSDSCLNELMGKLITIRAEQMNCITINTDQRILQSLDKLNNNNDNNSNSSIGGSRQDYPLISIRHPSHKQLTHPKMRLKIDIKYENLLSSKLVERSPRLHMFTSSDFCNILKVWELGEEPVTNRYGLLFEGKLFINYIPNDLNLNFQVFTDVLNESDDWCGNQAGSCRIRFSDILKVLDAGRVYSREHDLVVTAADDFLKGRLHVRIGPKDLFFSKKINRKDPRHQIHTLPPLNDKYVKQRMMEFIGKKYKGFQKIAPTWYAIRNIHAYVYKPPSSIVLPAAAFDIPFSRPADESFYLHLLTLILARYCQTYEWFLNEADDQQVGRVVTEMSTIYVNWCKYIPDLIYTSKRKKGGGGSSGGNITDRSLEAAKKSVKYVESFDCVRSRGLREEEEGGEEKKGVQNKQQQQQQQQLESDPTDASDCEDFAKESLEFFHQIRTGLWKSPAMKRITDNCDYWYNFSVLGGVSNAKLDGHFEKLKKMNAHEYVIRIPKAQMWHWLKAGAPHSHLHKMISEKVKHKGLGLKVLVAEGTGLLYPDETNDPSSELRDKLTLRYPQLMKQLRKRYSYMRGKPGSFYKTCTTLFTSDFAIDSLPYLEFYLCENKESSSSSSSGGGEGGAKRRNGGGGGASKQQQQQKTYGVHFSDVSSQSDKVCIRPQAPLLKEDRRLVKHIMKDLYHPPPFKMPSDEQLLRFANSNFVKLLKQYSVHHRPGSDQRYISDAGAVACFIKSNKATTQLAHEIIQLLREQKMKISVKPELVTDTGVGGYYLILLKE